jgi:ABC-type multidrug transport system fused ATPase/permease subunit
VILPNTCLFGQVLDEATSSIDPITEVAIQRAVHVLCSKHSTTLLAIAHRLDTVIDMDKILVMVDGEVNPTPTSMLQLTVRFHDSID